MEQYHNRAFARRTGISLFATASLALATAACGSTAPPSTMNHGGAATAGSSTPTADHTGMGNMDDMHGAGTGDGLSATAGDLMFMPTAKTLPAGKATSFAFTITKAGAAVTAFEPDQTKLMHFYVIRDDLTGFQHVHPTMAGDGTWTAPLNALRPGAYRAYAAFITKDATGKATPYVLSDQVAVAGTANRDPIPAPAKAVTVDGYTLTLSDQSMMANMEHSLTVTVTRAGQPVTDLEPYLDTYAHLTAFHDGDLAFAHLHPTGGMAHGPGGPTLTFAATLPKPGKWRLYLQFQTAGTLHTAAITLAVS